LGLPALIIAIAPNQLAVAQAVAQQGAAEYLGPITAVAKHIIAERLGVLCANPAVVARMSERAIRLMGGEDFGGAGAVARILLEECHA
jgi:hypothetical protein